MFGEVDSAGAEEDSIGALDRAFGRAFGNASISDSDEVFFA